MSGFEHYNDELYTVEMRITRVAIACGIDVHDRVQLEAVKSGNFSLCTNGNAHSQRLLQELLQMLDYIMNHCVNERGSIECGEIFAEVEARLNSHGFAD